MKTNHGSAGLRRRPICKCSYCISRQETECGLKTFAPGLPVVQAEVGNTPRRFYEAADCTHIDITYAGCCVAGGDCPSGQNPVEFSIGDRTFPPGDYSLVQPMQHLLALRDARGQTIASAFTSGIDSSAAPAISKLKFHSLAGQNVLTEVWQQDSHLGQKLFATKTRSTFAKHRSTEARETAEGSQP